MLRRRALQWLAAPGGSAAGFAGCGGGSDDASTADDASTTAGDGSSTGSSASTSCTAIPEESAGPYPVDSTTRRCCR
ncbi:hypothetical protein [Azohydromonas caseinilytica]|uniref:Uncharacterized protein n=1 Tax=Azohydromonas caseinilytica TaxID=2728836 RepID=A0A848FEM9_9BURK|nr:hypothetical protein [Azohydromonas caseinilytica]NML18677.1 hypothetical protein [Azohydromonas caseinilytica]